MNAFLWLHIIILRICALSFFSISGFCPEVLLFVWDLQRLFSLCLPPRSSGTGVSESREWVALLGVPFGEGLSLDCGSSFSSSGFLSSFIVSLSDSGLRNGFLRCSSRISFLLGAVCAVLEIAVKSIRLLHLVLGGQLRMWILQLAF